MSLYLKIFCFDKSFRHILLEKSNNQWDLLTEKIVQLNTSLDKLVLGRLSQILSLKNVEQQYYYKFEVKEDTRIIYYMILCSNFDEFASEQSEATLHSFLIDSQEYYLFNNSLISNINEILKFHKENILPLDLDFDSVYQIIQQTLMDHKIIAGNGIGWANKLDDKFPGPTSTAIVLEILRIVSKRSDLKREKESACKFLSAKQSEELGLWNSLNSGVTPLIIGTCYCINAIYGYYQTNIPEIESAIQKLISLQENSGWSYAVNDYNTNPIATSYVLETLATVKFPKNDTVKRSIIYLKERIKSVDDIYDLSKIAMALYLYGEDVNDYVNHIEENIVRAPTLKLISVRFTEKSTFEYKTSRKLVALHALLTIKGINSVSKFVLHSTLKEAITYSDSKFFSFSDLSNYSYTWHLFLIVKVFNLIKLQTNGNNLTLVAQMHYMEKLEMDLINFILNKQ